MCKLKYLIPLLVVLFFLTRCEEEQKTAAQDSKPEVKISEVKRSGELWETPSGLLLHLAGHDRNKASAFVRVASLLGSSGGEKQVVLTALNHAKKSAYEIKPTEYRISTLMSIASEFSNAGYKNEAQEILKQAIQETTKIKDESKLANVLINFATHYRNRDEKKTLIFLKQAMEVATKIKDEGLKQPILRKISEVFLQIGEVRQVIEISQKMRKTSDKVDILELIVFSLAGSGKIEQAIMFTQQIKQTGGWKKSKFVFDYIARAEASKGNVESALKIAQMTQGKEAQASSKRKVLIALTKAGKVKQAVEIAQKIEDANEKISTRIEMALALVEKEKLFFGSMYPLPIPTEKEKKQAYAILKPVLASLAEKDGATYHLYYLKKAASVLLALGEKKQAVNLLNQALKLNEVQTVENRKDYSLSKIVFLLIQAEEIEQAVNLTKKIKSIKTRGIALNRIAKNLLKRKKKKRAISILKQSIEEAQKIKEWSGRDPLLAVVVSLLVDAGKIQDALKVTQKMTPSASFHSRAVSYNEMIPGYGLKPYDRPNTLRYIAWSFTQSGDVSQALKVIQKIKVPREKAKALRQTASFLVEKKDIDQAVKLAHQIDNLDQKSYALLSIAQALATSGKFKWATELISKTKKPNIPMLVSIAEMLAFQPSPKTNLVSPFSFQKIKKSFTLEEKQFAKQLVQAMLLSRNTQNKR